MMLTWQGISLKVPPTGENEAAQLARFHVNTNVIIIASFGEIVPFLCVSFGTHTPCRLVTLLSFSLQSL